METLKADTHSLQMLKGAEIQHSDLMFDFQQIDVEYKAYQYKKFDKLVDQLNWIKEYDYKHGIIWDGGRSVIDTRLCENGSVGGGDVKQVSR